MNLEAQMEIDQEIGQCVLTEMDEDETEAELSIDIVGEQYRVVVHSDTRSAIMPSDDLLQAAGALVDLHSRAGTGLAGMVYRYSKNEDGSWAMGSSFEYGEPAPHFGLSQQRRGWRRWFGRG
ncbi:hypothetical protein ABZ540_14685 [Nocardia xishanensis]|uniref:hypothetical protein n=1 Tax=Nocardia xishanensis TaxID=238964 RepID=UPI0033E3E941